MPANTNMNANILPGRVAPHNIEAEQAVLGAMMLSKEAITAAQEILHGDDFYRAAHRILFEVMTDLHNQNEAVDLVTVAEGLRKSDQLDKVGGIPFITQIVNTVPNGANVVFHAKIVKEKADLRRLITAADAIANSAYEDADSVENIMDNAEKQILSISSAQTKGGFEPIMEVVSRTVERLMDLYDNAGTITGLDTGFKDLNELTAGLQPSDLILVAARPSMGKTAFTLNIASHVGLAGHSVAFFSLEMSKEQLMQRMICAEGELDASKVRTGTIEEAEWNRLFKTADKLGRAKIYIDDTAGITVMELRSKARRLMVEHGLDLIIIDYLQLMQGRPSKNGDNRQQEISEISRSLKALARELNVPVIALSQLSRSVESRQIKRPMLSDLRESGSLEQDADIVMFLYREDYYDKDTENKNITEVIVAKHRNGPVDTVSLFFQKEFTRFRDLARQ